MYVNVMQQYFQDYVTKNSTAKNCTENCDCAQLVLEYVSNITADSTKNITDSDAVKLLQAEGTYPQCQNYFRLYIWQTYLVYVLPQIIQIFTGIAKNILSSLTTFEKHETKSELDNSLTVNQFLVAYFIQGITLILVSLRIDK
jgi:hypothetical protein